MALPCFISGPSGSSCVTAALGNTWSHSVNTRLIFQYLGSERRQCLTAALLYCVDQVLA
ncbi:dna repair protein rad51 homolog 2 [Lynx pardinus]|uniref:Dna repair protein rad51 homolog 2 n=1 Tax=Lynx pardinus TaxID=191816 RepID=A0A485NET3_LYNPA|nr:dna repair protein rad51 homolog 2 [Lynx pardinus]